MALSSSCLADFSADHSVTDFQRKLELRTLFCVADKKVFTHAVLDTYYGKMFMMN